MVSTRRSTGCSSPRECLGRLGSCSECGTTGTRHGSRWRCCRCPGCSGLVVACRRVAYRIGLLSSIRVARPVVVIGNITVGGTGKTPFTIWLADAAAAQAQARWHRAARLRRHTPIIGRATWIRTQQPQEVGDEAVLLAKRTAAIVVAGPDRVAAARRAIERGAEIVLSDDGLQHYRLARDREIVVIDGRRGVGNRRMLPGWSVARTSESAGAGGPARRVLARRVPRARLRRFRRPSRRARVSRRRLR